MTSQFPVPQESVEAGLLAAIGQDTDNWLQVSGFSSDDFVAHRSVFQFIGQYLSQYGQLPSAGELNTRFGWSPPIGNFEYWLAEMKRYAMARQVMEVMQEAYDKIATPDVALSSLIDKLSLIRSSQTNHIQATDHTGIDRFERFNLRTENIFHGQQMIGLRTKMNVIDSTRIGWTPASMVGCYARPGVGKTWWLLWQGINAWLDGGTVLAITPEMPANWLDLRIDVLAGEALGYPIDYQKLLIGDPSIRDNYEMITKIMTNSNRWWTYDSINDRPVSLGDLVSLVKQHQPNIVLIDGISLLRTEARGQVWEQMKEASYGLKNLGTIYEVPILVTHQAVNSNRGSRSEPSEIRGDDFHMPSLSDAAYGDSFVQACSDVITMCGEKSSPYINWYRIAKHRERGWITPLASRMALICDFGKGKIIDVSELGYNPEAVGVEARRLLNR